MLTEKNFAAALKAMGFTETGGVYEKTFAENVSMSANLKTKKFSYPAQIKNRDRNNFFDSSHKENFVVFECVNRLLDKGYNPADITLEKAWHLGHTSKSGRADICVSQNEKTLFIIECKTEGAEYKKELENLNLDGGQLFSYRQQEQSCQWLVLYASDFEDGAVKFSAASVSCHEEIYQNAKTVEEFFKIWRDVLYKPIAGDVIFHDETVAYKIGVKPLRKKNLIEFDDTKIVNRFEEILRHNHDSNKPRAFDVLVALLICKLADENSKTDDQEVDFQFKFGSDDYFTFQDRLRALYKIGMNEFMNKKITDISMSEIEELFFQFKDDVLLNSVKDKFREQKFFTTNYFSFIDVDDEELFYKNATILQEVVDIFKDYKIIGAKNLQTLGDLFEQLLDKGFKQDEGMFFTPIPITRFIWDSLPLENIISAEKNFILPKIIDYACGAGHFLTQAFEAINDFFARQNISPPIYWEDEKLFGVEKDERLARVSKISFFMHGADKGKIKFGNGLENYPDEGIAAGTFDILVSNPPYSIKDFTQYLQVKNNFDTLAKISKNGSEIETLFVERIAQLVKPGGIAAVILPSSILNKDGKSFISAREKILQNFYIRAIAEFGSKTFGATGTKTNILFLEKISPKEKFDLFLDTVNRIFSINFSDQRIDADIFNAWLAKINVPADTYKKFILREVAYTNWQDDAYFADYFSAFTKKFSPPKSLKDADLLDWLNLKFYDFAHDIERQKIQYFAQAYTQTTLIISAPDDNDAQEKFLGYTWSNRKGDEGIKIFNAGGLLYDPTNRRADDRLAAAVRNAFFGKQISIPAAQNFFYYLNLADMIDFSGADFTKIITMSKISETTFSTDRLFPTEKLDKIVNINLETLDPTKTPDKTFVYVDIGSIDSSTNEINFSTEITGETAPSRARRIAYDGDILISTVRPYLKSFAIVKNSPANTLYSTGFAILSSKDENIILSDFIFYLFMYDPLLMEQIRKKMSKGSYPSINQNDIKNFYVPVPPLDEQKKIVDAFRAVDADIDAQKKVIAACDTDVKEKFAEMFGGVEKNISLSKICVDDTKHGEKIPASEYLSEGKFPIIDQSVNEIAGYSDSEENLYENLPCIIFGDHTEIFKYVTEKFFLGSDGVKILIPANRNEFNEIFLFHMLKTEYKPIGGYSRHFRNLNDTKFYLPPKELQEQFAEYVRVAEERKAAAQKRLAKLKAEREELVTKYFR